MKTKIVTFFFIIYLFLPLDSFAQREVTSLLKQVQTSTVLITVYDSQGNQTGQGSGFFISKKGEVVTNWHVINDASSAMVKTATGAMFKVKGVIAKDEKRDIAKIVLEAKDINFPYLNLSLIIPNVGDKIYVIGSPFGLESTVSDGLVSAVRNISDVENVIQISAPISPGSSGSPIINLDGKVVGVAAFQLIKGQNLNFAVSAMDVARLLSVSKASITPLGKEHTSKINPEVQLQDNGWIKIVSQFLDEQTPEEFYEDEPDERRDELIRWRKEGAARDKFRTLYVEIQFLKPCKATTLKPAQSEDFLKASPEETALFYMNLARLGRTEEERDVLIRDARKYCEKVGIDPDEFFYNVYVPRFRCNYRTKLFVTYFTKEGFELETTSQIPLALLIDSTFSKRKTEMLPGEKTYLTFFVPDKAESWHVWVPK